MRRAQLRAMLREFALYAVLLCLVPLGIWLCTAKPGAISDAMPPERFRKPGAALVFFVPIDDIAASCGLKPVEGVRWMGCQKGGVIVLPDPCPFGDAGEKFGRIACHEMAHRFGWGSQHEP